MGQGLVEVEGVGEVELGLEPQGAGVVDVLVVDRDVAGVDREVAVLGISSRIGGGEVVALDGLRDEPVELRGADPAGDGSDLASTQPAASTVRRGRCGWWPRRPAGPATAARVRPGPVPTVGGGGGGARGRAR